VGANARVPAGPGLLSLRRVGRRPSWQALVGTGRTDACTPGDAVAAVREPNHDRLMKLSELEALALELDVSERARLAATILESLDDLSEAEATRLWAAEAARRDAEMDADRGNARSADAVLRDARNRVG
jgi:hypothetical protein